MNKSFSKNDIARLRKIFCDRIEKIDPDKTAELALSGGTDSVTILFAMLETGRKPNCITFMLDDYVSSDMISSRALCNRFELNLNEILIPTCIDILYADVCRAISKSHVIKKTIIQCIHPWFYIYEKMKSDLIITGMGGDDLYCNQRKVQVALHKDGEESILKWRKVYSDDLNFSGGNIKGLANHYKKKNIDFYNDPIIENWFLEFPAASLNKVIEKYPSILAFEDYYKLGRFRRHHDSYQVNSRLRELHDRLLYSKYNIRKSKSVIAIYNDVALKLKGSK